MDNEQKREIEREITDVLLQNGRCTDQEEWEKAAALFAPDGVFKGISSGFTAVGREENVASMASRMKVSRRRVLSNIMITVQDADHATVTAYWLMFKLKKADVLEGKNTIRDAHRLLRDRGPVRASGRRLAHRAAGIQ